MPLKIRIKPEEKFFAGGAVLKNVSKHPVDLLVLSDSPVLRENYMMNIERRNDSDISNVYFLLQVIYLFRGKGQPLDTLVISTIKSFATLYPDFAHDAESIITHLESGNSFQALKVGHKLLEASQQLSGAQPQPSAQVLQ